jgi:hypothetical protein
MNQKFLPFLQHADIVVTDATKKAQALTSAVALAVANMQHIPSSQLDNPLTYFNLQIQPTISAAISEWNENIILDARECVNQTRMFWLLRYTAAYPASTPMYSADKDFFDTVFGVAALVPQELHEFLDGPCKGAILSLATIAMRIAIEGDD